MADQFSVLPKEQAHLFRKVNRRLTKGMSLRAAAKAVGISYDTLYSQIARANFEIVTSGELRPANDHSAA